MHDRQDLAGGTLDRLNDALSNLENRIGVARYQHATNTRQVSHTNELNQLSAIRARQDALRSAPSPKQSKSAGVSGEILREELRALRGELEQQMSGNVNAGFESLRNDLRSMQPQQAPNVAPQVSAATSQLRQDIAALKNDVAQLAREDTLQSMLDRWSVLENEIADLPQKLNSRDELIAMADRLDHVQSAIASLPQTNGVAEVEEQVRTLALAVERLAENSDVVNYPIESIDARFDELTRAIAALPTSFPAQPSFDSDAFDRIEARIGTLAAKLDEQPAASAYNTLDDQLNELVGGLQQLREETRAAVPSDALQDLSARMDQIATQLAEQPKSAVSSTDEEQLKEMNERLLYIIEKVNNGGNEGQDSAQSLVASLDQKMDEIARRIDANERSAIAVPSIDTLETRLDEIAQILSSGGGSTSTAEPSDNLANLEAQVAQLAQSLGNTSSSIDQDSLLGAARAAADEAVARLGADAGGDAADSLGHLSDDLKQLEALARDSDDRNSRTFEAIHDTLLKVVDHLSGLEDTVRSTPAFGVASDLTPMSAPVAKPAAAPEMPVAEAPTFEPENEFVQNAMDHVPETPRMTIPDAPSVAHDSEEQPGRAPVLFDDAPVAEPRARPALSPAQAAVAAARAAMEKEPSRNRPETDGVVESADEQSNKSLLKGMAQKLRRGAAKSPDVIQPVAASAVEVRDDLVGDPIISDEPIEPGQGGADLSAIMRRVREERAGTAPSASGSASVTGDDSGKSDFIAAARRAAKAAAHDATLANPDNVKGKSSEKASLGAMLAKRRKPILMGAGAILLALLSLPLLSGLFSSDPVDTQPQLTEIAPEQAPAAVDNIPAVPTVENADAQAVVEANDDPLTLSADEPAAITAEAVAVEEPVTAEPAPQQISLQDVPENVGPIALREAAVNGDPKALYLVGDYYTGGVPGQSENDLAKAFNWYERAAELGYAPAQYRVGNFFEKGFGVERDLSTAKTWYQLAAEQGNAGAMHNLAVLYANGPDGSPDFDSATRWFQKAAELGVKDSQFNLGILTAKGDGVTQDLAESYKWFAIAAKTGDKDAAAKRNEVAEALRPEQLETARGATELWKPKSLNEEVNIVSIPDQWRTDQAQTAAAKPEISSAEMKKAVRNIQGILNNNGYNAGPADGVMGNKTRNAIIAFKKANGMEANADVNEALVRKLLEINGKKSG